MNHSETTALENPVNTHVATSTYANPNSWEGSADEVKQDVSSSSIGHRAVEAVELCPSRLDATLDVVATRSVEVQPQPKSKRNDLGLWLLHGPGTRHDQWERILEALPDCTEALEPSNKYFLFAKRSCDFIASLFLLIALLPLFALTIILIKLDSSGPAFFRHYRVGRGGKQFMLWKFRSMKTDAPKYETSPRSVGDSRLTGVGRLIRRMSIDEIPQLFNVLKGEMSLVGPRPEMPFIVRRHHPSDCERLSARPGITGLWQISPARAFPIHENLQYDLHYVRNQNLVLDCAILLRTVTAVVRGIGAV